MIVAAFTSEAARDEALSQLRADGIDGLEPFGPKPPEDERSILPLVMLVAGIAGAAGGFWLQAWSTTIAYPIDIGGRPQLAWVSFIPFTFESGLMMAMIAGFAGFLLVNRLPTLWAPVDESAAFRRAMIDRWFVVVNDLDAGGRGRAVATLRAHGALDLEEHGREELARREHGHQERAR